MQRNLLSLTPAAAWRAALALLVGGGALGVYGRFIEPARLHVQRLTLPLARLPRQLDGMTIAQLSDLHILPHTQPAIVDRVVARVNALRPDFVALTGDFVCSDVAVIDDIAPRLARLRARYGLAAVLGNHDTKPDPSDKAQMVTDTLTRHGVPVLNNRALTLPNGLVVAGVEELYEGRPNLSAALAGVPPAAPVVLLAHMPDYADIVCREPRLLLQLSGHTHGGQIRLPGMHPFYLPIYGRKYVAGLYHVGALPLYVNRGIGLAYYLPLRLRCAPEIALITLRAT